MGIFSLSPEMRAATAKPAAVSSRMMRVTAPDGTVVEIERPASGRVTVETDGVSKSAACPACPEDVNPEGPDYDANGEVSPRERLRWMTGEPLVTKRKSAQ